MVRWTLFALLAVGLLALSSPAPACSLCASIQQVPTLREEAAQKNARIIMYGYFQNPRVGATDYHITTVLRSDPFIEKKQVVEIPKFQQVQDPKNPPKFLIFADVYDGKLDPYRGTPIRTAEGVEYVKKVLALDPKKKTENLLFFFRYLDHPDPEVARDAFMEFAKANDQEIGQVAGKLAPDKLRAMIKDPKTPDERVGLFAFLLGACGGNDDAALLLSLLRQNNERTTRAFDGLLGGYINLRPKEGWELALATLKDEKKDFQVRLAVVRSVQFFHRWQPKENRANALKAMAVMLEQSSMADVAVEELRRMRIWDMTREVLTLYGKKGYDAPLMKESIVRYALTCPEDAAVKQFLAERRRTEPDIVRDVEDSLRFEKK